MPIPFIQVDNFTSEPFKGNPAAVFYLEKPQETSWMQHVAAEMNLSETAFVSHIDLNRYHLRWFTPTREVKLCGHATLASAHMLWESQRHAYTEPLIFETLSGALHVHHADDAIHMEFPPDPPAPISRTPSALLKALGHPHVLYAGQSKEDYILELDSEEAVKAVSPDFLLLKEVESRGIIITSRSSSKHIDFVSRFFAPRFGIDEDPVTGSAYCALGCYWANKLNKTSLTAYQASLRGGYLKVEHKQNTIRISGQAVTVIKGTLYDSRNS